MTITDGQHDTVFDPRLKYDRRVHEVESLLCVGLDSGYDLIPQRFKEQPYTQFEFNRWIIAQTHPYVSAYKINTAFYEARGDIGIEELKITMNYLRGNHPDIFTICDAKRGDIGSTNEGYVTGWLDVFGFDAITLHPYLGREALAPFLEREDKISIILCRTSNPGAGEIQDLSIDGKPLWQVIAEKVAHEWNTRQNCMLVVGGTYPDELGQIREIVGDMTILVPGIGAQGADVAQVVSQGINRFKRGLIVSASRSIIFADNPAKAARDLRKKIDDSF